MTHSASPPTTTSDVEQPQVAGQPRGATIVTAAFFASLLLFFLTIPSLAKLGFPVGHSRGASLVIFLTSGAWLIIRALPRGGLMSPPSGYLLLAPTAALFSSVVKADGRGMLGAGLGIFAVLAVLGAGRKAALKSFGLVAGSFVAASLLLATVDSRFAFHERDFLPLIIEGRCFGLLQHPNAMAVICCLVFGRGLTVRSRYGRTLMIVGGIGLLGTASQSSLLAALVGLASVLVYRLRQKVGGPAFFALSCLTFAALPFYLLLGQWNTSLLPGIPTNETFSGRTDIWSVLLRQDVGFFGMTDARFTSITEAARGVGSAHDLWLEWWARSGVPGVVAVSVTLALVLWFALKRKSEPAFFLAPALLTLSITEGVLLSMPFIVLVAGYLQSLQGAVHDDLDARGSVEGYLGTGTHATVDAASLQTRPDSVSSGHAGLPYSPRSI